MNTKSKTSWWKQSLNALKLYWENRKIKRALYKKLKAFYNDWQKSDYQFHPINLHQIYDDIIIAEIYLVPTRLIAPITKYVETFFSEYYLDHSDTDYVAIIPRTICTEYTITHYNLTEIREKYSSFKKWIKL